MMARPIGKIRSGPGPGIGPSKGAPSTSNQPSDSIHMRYVPLPNQFLRFASFILSMWWQQSFPASIVTETANPFCNKKTDSNVSKMPICSCNRSRCDDMGGK